MATVPVQPSNSPVMSHDHYSCQSKALSTAEQLCQRRGVRFTAIRRAVLALIWESHRAVKAYDLLPRIKDNLQSAQPITVYRALDFLLEQGLIHRVESLNAYIGCSYSDHQHEQLLLTCSHCHEVEERPGELVMTAIAEELNKAAFTLHRQAIEVHGICKRCATAETSNT